MESPTNQFKIMVELPPILPLHAILTSGVFIADVFHTIPEASSISFDLSWQFFDATKIFELERLLEESQNDYASFVTANDNFRVEATSYTEKGRNLQIRLVLEKEVLFKKVLIPTKRKINSSNLTTLILKTPMFQYFHPAIYSEQLHVNKKRMNVI